MIVTTGSVKKITTWELMIFFSRNVARHFFGKYRNILDKALHKSCLTCSAAGNEGFWRGLKPQGPFNWPSEVTAISQCTIPALNIRGSHKCRTHYWRPTCATYQSVRIIGAECIKSLNGFTSNSLNIFRVHLRHSKIGLLRVSFCSHFVTKSFSSIQMSSKQYLLSEARFNSIADD